MIKDKEDDDGDVRNGNKTPVSQLYLLLSRFTRKLQLQFNLFYLFL
jgi:hypothetical protein